MYAPIKLQESTNCYLSSIRHSTQEPAFYLQFKDVIKFLKTDDFSGSTKRITFKP